MVNLKSKFSMVQNSLKDDKPTNLFIPINSEHIIDKITIPFEEYKELLIYKGKYLGIIEKKGVNNVKDKR